MTRARLSLVRRTAGLAACACFWLAAAGCVQIPREAPELSAQLGQRLATFESAHLELVRAYMDVKRHQVDTFLTDVWVPAFTRNVMEDPEVKAMWAEVSASEDPADRAQFALRLGPKLQAASNRKRTELMTPLDELQGAMEARLRDDYAQLRAINNAVTTFLVSAADVAEARDRYLAMLGVTQQEVGAAIDEVDAAVGSIVDQRDNVVAGIEDIRAYRARIEALVKTFRHPAP